MAIKPRFRSPDTRRDRGQWERLRVSTVPNLFSISWPVVACPIKKGAWRYATICAQSPKASDTTCGHKETNITPSIACSRQAQKQEALATIFLSTAVLRTLSLWLCSARKLRQKLRSTLVARQWARGHRLTLLLFCRRSTTFSAFRVGARGRAFTLLSVCLSVSLSRASDLISFSFPVHY